MDKKISEKLELFNQLIERIDDVYYRYATSFGITDTELCVLYALKEHNGEYLQSDICKQWSCSLQTIHTTIKGMEKKGLIELICKPDNKKNKYIHLTDKGAILTDRIMNPLSEAEAEAFAALTRQEQERILPLMQKYVNALEQAINKRKESL